MSLSVMYGHLKLCIVIAISLCALLVFCVSMMLVGVFSYVTYDCSIEVAPNRNIVAPFDMALNSIVVANGARIEVGDTLFTYRQSENSIDSIVIEDKIRALNVKHLACVAREKFGMEVLSTCLALKHDIDEEQSQLKRHQVASFASSVSGRIFFQKPENTYLGSQIKSGEYICQVIDSNYVLRARLSPFHLGIVDFTKPATVLFRDGNRIHNKIYDIKLSSSDVYRDKDGFFLSIALPPISNGFIEAGGRVYFPVTTDVSKSLESFYRSWF